MKIYCRYCLVDVTDADMIPHAQAHGWFYSEQTGLWTRVKKPKNGDVRSFQSKGIKRRCSGKSQQQKQEGRTLLSNANGEDSEHCPKCKEMVTPKTDDYGYKYCPRQDCLETIGDGDVFCHRCKAQRRSRETDLGRLCNTCDYAITV